MSSNFRIKLKTHGHPGRAAIFVSVMVLFHWFSLAALLYWIYSNGESITSAQRLPFLIFFAFGFYLSLMARDRWRVYKNSPFIEFGPDKVLLPRGRYGSRSEWISYDQILSFRVSGRPPLRFCLIGAEGKNFFFAESRFENKDVFSTFVLELRTRIRNLPEGEKQIALIDYNVTLAEAIWAKPAQVSYILVIIIFLAFVMESSLGVLGKPFELVRLGANAPELLKEGQYYRLVTTNFLHAGWLHLLVNLIALYGLGSVVERLVGPHRYICIYFLSGVAGAATSALLMEGPISVGASAAIFGVLGSMLMLNLQFKERLPASFSQSRSWWIFILGISAALPLLLPQISAGSHVGGFGVGFLLTYALVRDYQPEQLIISSSTPLTKSVSASILTITAFAVIFGLMQAGQTFASDQIKVMSQFVSSSDTDPDALNEFAWNIVIDPNSTKEQRQLAGEAARRADQEEPGRHDFLDTLANVYFLQGSIDEAIELQKEAIEKFDIAIENETKPSKALFFREEIEKQVEAIRGVYVSQLARFQYARFLKDGPPPEAWKIAIQLEPVNKGQTRKVKLRLDKPYPQGIKIQAVVVQGTLLVGHLEVQLPSSEQLEYVHDFTDGPALDWLNSSRLDVVFVQEKSVSKQHWNATKYAADVARLSANPIP